MPRFLIRSSYPEKLFARQRLHGSVRQPTLAAKALLIDFGGALKSTSCRPKDTGISDPRQPTNLRSPDRGV